MRKSNGILKIFIAFCLGYLLVIALRLEDIAMYLKPLLLPFLLYTVYIHKIFETKKLLLTALFFSWLGDCVLLFSDQGDLYFIIGLVLFLIAHFFYILLFTKQKSQPLLRNKSGFWLGFVAVSAYLFGFLALLLPKLGKLKLPVIIYALTISIMLLSALKGWLRWKKESKYFILIGAALFVLSDSILAVDKFYVTVPLATFWIMTTYLTAQLLLTYGILKMNKKQITLH
ncbi:lysoplasmalogenase [Flavobacterium sedimenticola]|uniref:Lysoplasmalogenase n=1 Tax=Flavobacterium sedimenticola TaxID=3043286 RepID=A0ABT6XNQ7_9FLAO|nr:lysoplasmalogenase [Flavobacterium sedimenticola]MDI9256716.1 lysoplasmalogenase [Flavobacterium sedimenticola]